MTTRTHVLISAYTGNGVTLNGSINKLQPPNRVDWNAMYDEISWTLTVLGISDSGAPGTPGATLPTAWSLYARFQLRQMHAGNTAQFQKPAWHNLTRDEYEAWTAEGKPLTGPRQPDPVEDDFTGLGSALIASDQTPTYNAGTGLFANPIRVTRTFKHIPAGLRMVIPAAESAFTGGTAPRFVIGLEVTGTTKGL